ncbi:effector-associated domain 2-containing protein [Actinomadura sediminis]|uniref:Effector-associated domain-containing protein n=1 Tax=Actinomadura sediminis TaxID=1038904 RepID=A0ABW3EL78_9ACTN
MSTDELGELPVDEQGGRWTPHGACVILAFDIAAFGDTARTDDVRRIMRDAMYRQIDVSLRAGGVEPADRYREDRGDGAMVLVRPTVGTEALLTTVVDTLRAELRRYNKAAADVAKIRLRAAVHTGEARHDGNGVVGTAVNHAFRILDAQPFKDALDESGMALAVVVSQRVYDDVVRHGPGLVDPDEYRPIGIAVKETEGAAWVRVPGAGAPRAEQGGGNGSAAGGGAEVAERPPAPAVAAHDVLRAGGVDGAGVAAAPGAVPPGAVFEVVDRMLDVPLMASESGREQVLGVLRGEIAGSVPRQATARTDVYAIVTTCLDYPGGLGELLAAIKGLAGEPIAVLRLEQTIARVLPRL